MTNPKLISEGVELTEKKNEIFGTLKLKNIDWRRACKFLLNCINQIKELHFKNRHIIYPSKSLISRFSDIDDKCYFVLMRNILTIFYCNVVNKFWIDFADFIFNLMNINYCFTI